MGPSAVSMGELAAAQAAAAQAQVQAHHAGGSGAGGAGGSGAPLLPPPCGSNPSDPLFIRDPILPSLNVGRNCFRFFQVQSTFREAHGALATAVAACAPPQHRLEALAEAINSVDALQGGGGAGVGAESLLGAGGSGGRLPQHAAQLMGRFAPLMLGGGGAGGDEREFPLLGCVIANLRGL